jgi:hypothetical protein
MCGHVGSTQEIVKADGEVVAKTTDEATAKHICYLLIVYENIQERKKSAAS